MMMNGKKKWIVDMNTSIIVQNDKKKEAEMEVERQRYRKGRKW